MNHGTAQLIATGWIDGSLGEVIVPVHGDVAACQVVGINIQLLLQERQLIILLFLVSMTLDMSKGLANVNEINENIFGITLLCLVLLYK